MSNSPGELDSAGLVTRPIRMGTAFTEAAGDRNGFIVSPPSPPKQNTQDTAWQLLRNWLARIMMAILGIRSRDLLADFGEDFYPERARCHGNDIEQKVLGVHSGTHDFPALTAGANPTVIVSGTKNGTDSTLNTKQQPNNTNGVDKPKKAPTTLGDILSAYEKDDCPDKDLKQRSEKAQKAELTNVKRLRPFWENLRPEDIRLSKCDAYHDLRIKQVVKGEGDRTVDMELTTLRNSLAHGRRRELTDWCPGKETWKRYHRRQDVQNCKQFMAHDIDEVHEFGGLLCAQESCALGFLYVLENITGLRSCEVLKLRNDAQPFTPGWITKDGNSLYVWRAKGQKNVNEFIVIHEGLREWLDAHRIWKAKHCPTSPWFFPSPVDPSKPMSKSALCRALLRLRGPSGKGPNVKPAKITRKIICHAGRAFYVTVRRSQGISDQQIALEIGHTSGGSTLEKVYGGVPPHWLTGGGPNMSFVPTGKRAWDSIKS